MVERVGKIARTKRVKFSSEEIFERKQGYEDKDNNQSFADILHKENPADIQALPSKDTLNPAINKAYKLEVGRPTQSLFYQGRVDISYMREKLLKSM